LVPLSGRAGVFVVVERLVIFPFTRVSKLLAIGRILSERCENRMN
jgi:hypothetical protein